MLSVIFKCVQELTPLPIPHPAQLYLLQPLSGFLCSGAHSVLVLCSPTSVPFSLMFLPLITPFPFINASPNMMCPSGVGAIATSAKKLRFIFSACIAPSCEVLLFFYSAPKEVIPVDLEGWGCVCLLGCEILGWGPMRDLL